MNPVVYNGTHWATRFTKLASISYPYDHRTFIRGAAAVVGLHSHFIMCGGLISSTIAAPDHYQCIEYDTKTGQNMLLPRPPWSFHSAGIVYSGNKIVVFGGGVITGSVPLSDVELNAVMILAVKPIVMCAANQTDDAACLNCPSSSCSCSCC